MASDHPPKKSKSLLEGVESLFLSKEFSDFTIVIKDGEIPVHKAVLCSQSEYFLKACNGHFKESKENRLYLTDDDPDLVKTVIEYMYKQKYTCPREYADRPSPLPFHIGVFALAEMFMVDNLQIEASANFLDAYLADGSDVDRTDFVQAVALTYTITQDETSQLRTDIVSVINDERSRYCSPDGIFYTAFITMLRQTLRLGADLAEKFVTTQSCGELLKGECETCDRMSLSDRCASCQNRSQ